MIPFLAWTFVDMGISGNLTISRIKTILLYPDGSFWFLWVLFWINIIFVIAQWIAEKRHVDELFPITTFCVLLLGVMICLEFRLFGFQFIAYYFLFYTLGYVIHRYSFLQIKQYGVLVLLFVAWLCLAWFWNMHELPSWMPVIQYVPISLLQYAYRGGTAVVAILFLLGLAPRVMDDTKGFINQFILIIGINSLGCYTVHLTFIDYVASWLNSLLQEMNDWGVIACIFVIILFLTFMFVELLKKNRYTAKILLGKI